MKICTLHGVTLRVHPLFLLILLLYTLAGHNDRRLRAGTGTA